MMLLCLLDEIGAELVTVERLVTTIWVRAERAGAWLLMVIALAFNVLCRLMGVIFTECLFSVTNDRRLAERRGEICLRWAKDPSFFVK